MSDEALSITSRRGFLGVTAFAAAALALPRSIDVAVQEAPVRPDQAPEVLARDETYWARVAAQFRVASSPTNLEAGYFGTMAMPVMAQFMRQIERVNLESSYFARGAFVKEAEIVRARVAAMLGADVSEIALTRGATEAMQSLIGGYNRLKPGDTVIYADLDYPGMQWAMKWLAERRGVKVVRFAIPEPATRESVLAAYTAILDAHPRARLILVTHVNNKTGLVAPVAAITAAARTRGVDVILDAAHALGQIDFKLQDLGADFIGFNLHKWIGAPVGVGALYIRSGRLADVDRMMADEDQPGDSVTSRVHSGTANFATILTVPAALDSHAAIGAAAKAARLRYLRDRWVAAVRGTKGIQILTPDEPGMVGAITSFRFEGRSSPTDVQRIVDDLLTRFHLFTVRRTGLDRGDCVRVTPAIHNTPAEVDRVAAALIELATERR